jgi:DNA (cytosine-5)-methyltransferase 1
MKAEKKKRGVSIKTKLTSKANTAVTSSKNRISHEKAYRLILDAEEKENHSGLIKDELAAIVSHWLQSPYEAPLVLGAKFAAKWRRLVEDQSKITAARSRKVFSVKKNPPFSFSALAVPPSSQPKFRFIDLFAGIGGFHQALHEAGGKCVFSSEWDNHAKETYFENYGLVPFGDITKFTESVDRSALFDKSIPEHDILTAGFPCQPFSQAGKQLGFNDARGTLFFEILKIGKRLRPSIMILENVKRLKTHDNGRTFQVIVNALHEIGYKVYAKVLRAFDYGLPQNRERIFIVAFREPVHFEFPPPPRDRLIHQIGDILENNTDDYYTISDRMLQGHERRLREHKEKGNGFGFCVFDRTAKYVNTLSARYWKDGSEILIKQDRKNPRLLTPRECARLQGFPDEFKINKSRRHAYQQFGNSVPVNVVKAVVDAALKSWKMREPTLSLFDPTEPVIS